MTDAELLEWKRQKDLRAVEEAKMRVLREEYERENPGDAALVRSAVERERLTWKDQVASHVIADIESVADSEGSRKRRRLDEDVPEGSGGGSKGKEREADDETVRVKRPKPRPKPKAKSVAVVPSDADSDVEVLDSGSVVKTEKDREGEVRISQHWACNRCRQTERTCMVRPSLRDAIKAIGGSGQIDTVKQACGTCNASKLKCEWRSITFSKKTAPRKKGGAKAKESVATKSQPTGGPNVDEGERRQTRSVRKQQMSGVEVPEVSTRVTNTEVTVLRTWLEKRLSESDGKIAELNHQVLDMSLQLETVEGLLRDFLRPLGTPFTFLQDRFRDFGSEYGPNIGLREDSAVATDAPVEGAEEVIIADPSESGFVTPGRSQSPPRVNLGSPMQEVDGGVGRGAKGSKVGKAALGSEEDAGGSDEDGDEEEDEGKADAEGSVGEGSVGGAN